jgi:ABC-type phosphate transport system substrate-binding protein
MKIPKIKNFIISLTALMVLIFPGLLFAEVVIIVHPSSKVSSLTKDDVSRLFLGQTNRFPNGDLAIPINQNGGTGARDEFLNKILKRNEAQYKAYWSKMSFTGKGNPPKDSGGDAAVKALVSTNPKMIGYIDSSLVDSSVKVVFR